jgi:outer membrane protein assembly factor BamB
VLAADQDGNVHAFDRHSGASRWLLPSASSTPWNGPDFRPLALSGQLLIAGSLTGGVTAYDLATRRERWRRTPMAASIVFGIAADDRAVYVPYLAGRLIALEADTGDERWRTSPDASGFSWKPLLVAGRLLAASSSTGFFAFRL